MSNKKILSEELQQRISAHRLRQAAGEAHKWPRDISEAMAELCRAGIARKVLSAESGIATSILHRWFQQGRAVKKPVSHSVAEKFIQLTPTKVEAPTDGLEVQIAGVKILGFKSGKVLVRFLREAGLLVSRA